MDLQRMIRTIAKTMDADYLSVYKTEETRAQFQAEGLMEDGLHLTSERTRIVIEKVLERIGVETRVKGPHARVDRLEIWPHMCWICGAHRRNCNEIGHRKMDPCTKCGKEGHHQDVCWFTYKMCQNFGRRGHGGDSKLLC